MKILHVISSMDPRAGGPCQGIRNLMPQAQAAGHSVEVVCLDNPVADYLSREIVAVHALGQGRSAWSYHPALRPWLESNLKRFDAVILNGLWQYPGYLLSKLTQQPGMPPYFVFPHGMLDPWFQRAPERRLKAVRNWFYWKLIERRVISRAAAVLFTCAEELRLARLTFRPYQPQREINVGYGVDQPPIFHERMVTAFAEKCSDLNGRPYFLFLSRIHPKKGLGLLIRAYAKVYHSKEKNSPASDSGATKKTALTGKLSTVPVLVIAGPGLDTDHGKQMQRLAATLCPADSVLWPGMLTGDAKWGALYQAEAFVLTSHQENFGIAVVESLACGKPVLISNQINIWKEIEEDQAGLVSDDTLAGAEDLFCRWERLTPEARSAMNRAAKASYENCFGIGVAAKSLLSTMEEVIKKRLESKQQVATAGIIDNER